MFGVSHPGVFGTLFCFFLNWGRGSKGGELTMGTAWEVKKVGTVSATGIFTAILHSKRCVKIWVKLQTGLQLQVPAQASKCYTDEWSPQHKDGFRNCMCRRHEQQWSALYQMNSCDTLKENQWSINLLQRLQSF